jgi:hypothetical protein
VCIAQQPCNSPIGRHKVLGLNSTERDDLVVRPLVALHSDSLDGQERDKRLRDVVVQPGLPDLFDVDDVGGLEDGDLFPGNFTEDSDGETRAGEGVTADEVGGNIKQSTESSDLVYRRGVARTDMRLSSVTTALLRCKITTTHP